MEPKISRINLLNSSMRQENSLFLVDRISALPDSILGIILSHLPTKNAVATTILSKRWKFVWMIVHNLDFCLEDSRNELPEEEDMKFVQFVNRVLLLLDGGLLNKFRLVWGPRFIPSQVSTWISIAITRNVHHLFVSVRNFDPNFYEVFDNFEALEMPVSVVNSDSLQCLELNVNISVSAAIVVCLPRLKSLKLVSVYFKSEEAFEQLICGCPKLNYLHLHINIDKMTSDDFRYIISSTSLRRLELHVGYSESDCPPSLQLKASSLEYFELVGRISQVFVQGCLSSLVEADFSIRFRQDVYDVYSEDICNSFVKAVRAFDCAKSLTLSMHAMWALDNATIGLSTKFTRLTKLEAGVLCIYCRSLRDFIQSSDSLEVLTIEQECGSLEASDDEYSDWTAPVEVPRCLSNNLKAVAIKGYYGYDDEREMIGYMLKHGSALEVMQVTCHAYCTKRKNCELVKEIRRFPRKSPACKVEFIGCAWEIRAEAAEHGASVTPYLHEMCVRGQFLQFS